MWAPVGIALWHERGSAHLSKVCSLYLGCYVRRHPRSAYKVPECGASKKDGCWAAATVLMVMINYYLLVPDAPDTALHVTSIHYTVVVSIRDVFIEYSAPLSTVSDVQGASQTCRPNLPLIVRGLWPDAAHCNPRR